MNIFVLDKDPVICARYHCDKHVVKMILESTQMLCTLHHSISGTDYHIPYKSTHHNHPCNRWLRDSVSNYNWLLDLTSALNQEYRFRYNKTVDHKSYTVAMRLPPPSYKDIGLTKWARAMPNECKIDDDIILSYRKYYNTKKKHLLQYTKRDKPKWIEV